VRDAHLPEEQNETANKKDAVNENQTERSHAHADDNKQVLCMECARRVSVSAYKQHKAKECQPGKLLTCDVCVAQYNKTNNLQVHQLQAHGDRSASIEVTNKIVCALCVKQFSRHAAYVAHLRVHVDQDDQVACDRCEKSFDYETQRQAHMIFDHATGSSADDQQLVDSRTMHVCTQCDRLLANNHELQQHNRLHKQIR
jgi:uncharacterized Fe-S center protein